MINNLASRWYILIFALFSLLSCSEDNNDTKEKVRMDLWRTYHGTYKYSSIVFDGPEIDLDNNGTKHNDLTKELHFDGVEDEEHYFYFYSSGIDAMYYSATDEHRLYCIATIQFPFQPLVYNGHSYEIDRKFSLCGTLDAVIWIDVRTGKFYIPETFGIVYPYEGRDFDRFVIPSLQIGTDLMIEEGKISFKMKCSFYDFSSSSFVRGWVYANLVRPPKRR